MTKSGRLVVPFAGVALGWRHAAAQRVATSGCLALYLLLLGIFWELWRATPLAELGRADIDAPHLLWYMAVTESVAIGVGSLYRAVEADIHSGRIAAGLMRPIPYSWLTLAEWIGFTAYRVLVLALCGSAAGLALTGGVAVAPAAAAAILVSTALACAIVLLCQLQIGYAAAWTGSAAPLFWIWQKLAFVLGGLILPLSLYPQPFRAIAEATPFSAMLFAPGSLVFAASPAAVAATIARQMFWLAVVGAASFAVDRAVHARWLDRGV
jgi:ABC-2 type transport system permease protein